MKLIHEALRMLTDVEAEPEEEKKSKPEVGQGVTYHGAHLAASAAETTSAAGTSNNPISSDAPATTVQQAAPEVRPHSYDQTPSTNPEAPAQSLPDSQTSNQSFHADIPSWYPQSWPPPPNLLSTISDPTTIYTLSHLSISTSALPTPFKSEVSSLLDSHFPRTHYTSRLTPLITAPSVLFPNSNHHIPPLAKLILLDSQSPDIKETFNKTANRVIDVLRKWKAQGRLAEAGKILFLDYRVVGASVKLITDGMAERDMAPGAIEESREKRELLGRLWKENFFLGCVRWDGGVGGEVRGGFERGECL